ncbi:MAG: PA14 domain-containing protein [Pyrinomonadaceae bacterium]
MDLKPAIGTKVYYTLDGTTPDERSRVYDKPFVVELKQDETVELKTVVANSVGRKSVVYVATLVRKEMMQAVEPQSKMTGKTPGVNYSLYVPSNAYAQDTPPQKGESRSIDLQQFAQRIDPTKTFGVTFEGYINIAVDGIYNFQIDSTNDRQLTIDGQTLIDEAGTKERAIKSVVVPLKAGWHKIAMHYDHREGEMFFRVRYGLKGQGLTRIGGGELVH